MSSSDDFDRDTSELVAMFIRAKNYLEAHAHKENDPAEELDPSEDEPSVKSPLPTRVPKSPIPTPIPKSLEYTPTSLDYTPASPNYTRASPNHTPSPGTDSNNCFHSALSV